ncbi:MAG: CBS domain-containing protein [Phycisphaerae bacterium]
MSLSHLATRRVVSIAPQDSLDKAISLMEEHHVHHLPVVAGGQLVGIISDRDLLLAVGWKLSSQRKLPEHASNQVAGPRTVSQIMTHEVISVTPEHTPRQAARTLIDLKIGAVPLVADGQLLGIVSDSDLLRVFSRDADGSGAAHTLAQQPVRSIMRTHLAKVRGEASLHEIITILQDRHVRHVPVVDENGGLIGIVSDRDVRRALGSACVNDMQAQETGKYYDEPRSAAGIMTSDVVSVAPTTTVGEATHYVLERRIHSLPVVERNALVGIVTTSDILREAARQDLLG